MGNSMPMVVTATLATGSIPVANGGFGARAGGTKAGGRDAPQCVPAGPLPQPLLPRPPTCERAVWCHQGGAPPARHLAQEPPPSPGMQKNSAPHRAVAQNTTGRRPNRQRAPQKHHVGTFAQFHCHKMHNARFSVGPRVPCTDLATPPNRLWGFHRTSWRFGFFDF